MRIDERRDPGDRCVDHPSAGLDGSHPAHLEVLVGRCGEAVGSVVHRDHEEGGAIADERARDGGERVLETDGSAERRQSRCVDRVHRTAGRPIDRDLPGGADPVEPRAPGHVLAERDEVHLVVPVDTRSLGPEHELRGPLEAAWIVHDRSDRGRNANVRDRPLDGDHRRRVARGGRVQRPLPPQDEVGSRRRSHEGAVQRDVLPCDEQVLLHRRCVRGRSHVDLDHRYVERVTGRFGEWHRERGKDERERRDAEPRPPDACTAPAGQGLEQQDVHDDDDQGDPPHPRDRRERQERPIVNLGDPDAPPGEPSEREHAPDPVNRRPQGGEPDGRSDRPAFAEQRWPDGSDQRDRGRRECRECEPCQGAEQEDPVEGCAEERQPERQAEDCSTSRPRTSKGPQQRDEGHERERPQLDGREGKEQQPSAPDGEGECGRKRDGRRAAQAQSRQSILRLSASWLRCFTR